MSDNLALWHLVEKTPLGETKPISGKSYKGTSPKPHYLIHKATETFGPCGIGWGFEIVDEKLLDGALLEPGFFHRIHMARVRVWYEWQGKRGVVEHVGQTEFCGRRKGDAGRPGAPFTDEDAPKKSVTDALVKALSLIGFAGDIFAGRYDDSKYVNDLRREEREERQELSSDIRNWTLFDVWNWTPFVTLKWLQQGTQRPSAEGRCVVFRGACSCRPGW